MDDNFFENPSHPLDLSLSDLNELRLQFKEAYDESIKNNLPYEGIKIEVLL